MTRAKRQVTVFSFISSNSFQFYRRRQCCIGQNMFIKSTLFKTFNTACHYYIHNTPTAAYRPVRLYSPID